MKNKRLITLLVYVLLLAGCNDGNYGAFQARMKQIVADPHDLQSWAVSMMKTNDLAYEIPKNQWPAYLTVTNGPSSAWIAGWA